MGTYNRHRWPKLDCSPTDIQKSYRLTHIASNPLHILRCIPNSNHSPWIHLFVPEFAVLFVFDRTYGQLGSINSDRDDSTQFNNIKSIGINLILYDDFCFGLNKQCMRIKHLGLKLNLDFTIKYCQYYIDLNAQSFEPGYFLEVRAINDELNSEYQLLSNNKNLLLKLFIRRNKSCEFLKKYSSSI